MIRSLLSATIVAILAQPSAGGTVVITDDSFANTDWELLTRGSNLSSSSAAQFPSGGNPGSFRGVRAASFGSGQKTESSFSINSANPYDPSSEGAIESLRISGETIRIPGGSLQGTSTNTRFALRQDGDLYLSNFSFNANLGTSQWLDFESPELTESDFGLFFFNPLSGTNTILPTSNPDFSDSGEAIEFGYRYFRTFGSNQSFNFDVTSGVDNWTVRLTTEAIPEPSSLVISASGVLIVLLRRSRS